MTDIALIWQTDGADIAVGNADILLDDSLSTAVIISLFTDRRALDSDELPAGPNTDKRGWWGDAFQSRPMGSRLWLLAREKQMTSVLIRAKTYADEALVWLIDEQHVRRVQVIATAPRQGVLHLAITLTLPNGSTIPLSFNTTLNGI
ncbi:phage GP46 family protein [Yersinia massiliensis]|uniref:phage GP46 family protein n=1 Tax=Yersinia massiliensis TaxID=419257 RepID=UPI0028D7840E|nr:phage GP46 family protein [Yersinia massiliensis]